MSESAPAPTLHETLRGTLADAPAPLALKDLIKGLKKAKGEKAPVAESAAEFLAAEIEAGRVFKTASGPMGAERYWTRDENEAIRAAVLAKASPPAKLADLKKAAQEATKADKAFAHVLADEVRRQPA